MDYRIGTTAKQITDCSFMKAARSVPILFAGKSIANAPMDMRAAICIYGFNIFLWLAFLILFFASALGLHVLVTR
jgi:hypothetical protein